MLAHPKVVLQGGNFAVPARVKQGRELEKWKKSDE